jgi:predicted component of type VI protein secretion system
MITESGFTIGGSAGHSDYPMGSGSDEPSCTVIRRNGVNYLKNLQETGGVSVDGRFLNPDEEVLLKRGAIVRIGDETLIFRLRKED